MMDIKKLRSQQSLKAISHDALLANNNKKKKPIINTTNESITHLPELTKNKSLTSNSLNIKKLSVNEILDKSPINEKASKSNLLLNNNFIEISKDSDGNLMRRSLKNESIIDLIGSKNNINKNIENINVNIGTYTKSNTREKKIVPQWQNLVNDVTDNLEDKLKISRVIILKVIYIYIIYI